MKAKFKINIQGAKIEKGEEEVRKIKPFEIEAEVEYGVDEITSLYNLTREAISDLPKIINDLEKGYNEYCDAEIRVAEKGVTQFNKKQEIHNMRRAIKNKWKELFSQKKEEMVQSRNNETDDYDEWE